MREKVVRPVAPEDLHLLALVRRARVRDEALEVEHERRTVKPRRRPCQVDLLPVGVPLAPEPRAPPLVERVERSVLRLEPPPKRGAAALAVALFVLVVELVVDLPADDVGAVCVVLAELLDDAPRQPPVDLAVVAVVAPRLVVRRLARREDVQRLRVLRRQPLRRRRGRRAEDDLDPVLSEQDHRAVEEREIELALAGLHQRPGELADAHDVDAGRLHRRCVLLPEALGTELGVVVDAEEERAVAIRSLGRRRRAIRVCREREDRCRDQKRRRERAYHFVFSAPLFEVPTRVEARSGGASGVRSRAARRRAAIRARRAPRRPAPPRRRRVRRAPPGSPAI